MAELNAKACGRIRKKRMSVYILLSYLAFGIIPILFSSWLCNVLSMQYYRQVEAQEMEHSINALQSGLLRICEDYLSIAKTLASYPQILSFTESGGKLGEDAVRLVRTLQLGQEERIQIHILAAANGRRYSTGSVPNLYSMPLYREYGVFALAAGSQEGYAVKATKLATYAGAQVALSLVKTLENSKGDIVGFVVVDIYRSELEAMLRQLGPSGLMDAVVLDPQGGVAYAMRQARLEGETPAKEELMALTGISGLGLNPAYAAQTSFTVPGAGLTVLLTRSQQALNNISKITLNVTLMISILTALLAGGCAILLSKRVSRQVKRLLDTFEQMKKEGLKQRFAAHRGDFSEIQVIGTRYNELIEQVEQLISRAVEKQKRLNTAEIKALESQIKPHFLYNVLNDIKSLAKLGRTREVSELVVSFGNVLRISLNGQGEFTTVEEDVQLMENYIVMQNIRHDGTIRSHISIQPEIMMLKIPRFVLQPIVENAIIHGLKECSRRHISVKGYMMGSQVLFEITDNGVGFGVDTKAPGESGNTLHEGIGLANIRRRLQLYYGDSCYLDIQSKKGCYTKVTVRFAASRI